MQVCVFVCVVVQTWSTWTNETKLENTAPGHLAHTSHRFSQWDQPRASMKWNCWSICLRSWGAQHQFLGCRDLYYRLSEVFRVVITAGLLLTYFLSKQSSKSDIRTDSFCNSSVFNSNSWSDFQNKALWLLQIAFIAKTYHSWNSCPVWDSKAMSGVESS